MTCLVSVHIGENTWYIRPLWWKRLLGTSYLPVWSSIPPSLHHRSCLLMNSMTWDSTWLLLIGYMLISSYGLVYLLISQDRSYIVVLLTLCLLLDLGRLYLDLPQRSEYCLFMCLVWDDWIWYWSHFLWMDMMWPISCKPRNVLSVGEVRLIVVCRSHCLK